jgi:hypothetical protein
MDSFEARAFETNQKDVEAFNLREECKEAIQTATLEKEAGLTRAPTPAPLRAARHHIWPLPPVVSPQPAGPPGRVVDRGRLPGVADAHRRGGAAAAGGVAHAAAAHHEPAGA